MKTNSPNFSILKWEEILLGSPTRIYAREAEVQISYREHNESKIQTYGSVENYLRILTTDKFEDVFFMKNKFNYKLSPGIRHYVAWLKKDKNFTADQIITLALKHFPSSEITAWENHPGNRSIDGIRHYHVFVR